MNKLTNKFEKKVRLRYAYKIVESYEKTMKLVYSNLVSRLVEARREVREEKLIRAATAAAAAKPNSAAKTIDTNMRTALDLASTVLNLTHDELGDILSPCKNNNTNNSRLDVALVDSSEAIMDVNQLLFEFEQHLNASRREKKQLMMSNNSTNAGVELVVNYDDQNQAIVSLMSKRLSEVLGLERELGYLKTSAKSIS